MEIQIRQASWHDARRVLDFVLPQLSQLGINPEEFWVETIYEEQAELKHFAEADNSVFLLAETQERALDPKRIVGLCTLTGRGVRTGYPREKDAHVAQLGLIVHKDLTGKGIGTGLLLSALGWAKRSGVVKRIEVESYEPNERARSLYMRLGFKMEGRKMNAVKVDGAYVNVFMLALLLTDRESGFDTTKSLSAGAIHDEYNDGDSEREACGHQVHIQVR